jgi:TolB protein
MRAAEISNGMTMTQSNDSALNPLTRRRVVALGAGMAAGLWLRPAAAAPRIDITQGNPQPLPIAIPEFLGSDTAVAHGVRDIIASNLRRSGLFAPIDPAAYIEKNNEFRRPALF